MPSKVELFPNAPQLSTAPADGDQVVALTAADGAVVRFPFSAIRSTLGKLLVASSMIAAKTADYTVAVADSGMHFSNTGAAGSVNFTLPAVAAAKGLRFWIHVAVDQPVVVTAPTGTLVGPNNAGRTSYTTGASGQRIGTDIAVFCDGAKYFLELDVKGLTLGAFA